MVGFRRRKARAGQVLLAFADRHPAFVARRRVRVRPAQCRGAQRRGQGLLVLHDVRVQEDEAVGTEQVGAQDVRAERLDAVDVLRVDRRGDGVVLVELAIHVVTGRTGGQDRAA